MIDDPKTEEDDLQENLMPIVRQRKRWEEVALLLLSGLCFVVFGRLTLAAPGEWACFLYLFLTIFSLSPTAFFWARTLTRRNASTLAKTNEVEHYLASNDIRALGALLDFYGDSPFWKLSAQHKEILKNLLSGLKPEEGQLLSRKQKKYLVHLLYCDEKNLALAIFRALEQVGNEDQLALLKRRNSYQSVFGAEQEVRDAYRSCVAAIEARAALGRSGSQLLRPSSSLERADTYLRPVTQKVDEDADTLLRAEMGTKEED